MVGNDFLNKTYMIKGGPYKNIECVIKKVQTNPVVKIFAEIEMFGKVIEIELKPEEVGINIDVELPAYPPNIIETFFNNCVNNDDIKKFLNKE